MKTLIKNFLEKFAPRLRWAVTSYQNRRLCEQRFGVFQKKIRRKIFSDGKPVVLSGPFAGLRYIDEIIWGPITPKWLGTYESELHPVINDILSGAQYKAIINVGAAEGYYAVALAKHLPNIPVFTFDLDFRARRQQRRLARLNQVKNLIIGFCCDSKELQRLIQTQGCLVICDVEGYEVQLLDPASVPALKSADILVELHPTPGMSVKAVHDLLKNRFAASHQIETLEACPRVMADFKSPLPVEVNTAELLQAMDEGRNGAQYWLWMRHQQ